MTDETTGMRMPPDPDEASDYIESQRKTLRLHRADKIAREVRYLLAEDGVIDGTNSSQLLRMIESWMRASGSDKYERPRT